MSNICTLLTLYIEKWNDAFLMTHNFIYPLISSTKEINKNTRIHSGILCKKKKNTSKSKPKHIWDKVSVCKFQCSQSSKFVVWSLEIYLITYHSSNKLITVRSKEVSDQFSQWKHPSLFHGMYTDDQRFVIR